MPSDETRRLLKLFGVAVTTFEDRLERRAPAEEITAAEGELDNRLREINALIDALRRKK